MPGKRTIPTLLGLLTLLTCSAGCRIFAAPFLLFGEEPTEEVKAEWPHLPGKHIAVLIWADSNTRFEYPNVCLELAEHLRVAMEPHLVRASFVPVRDVVEYQRSNPDWDLEDPAALGARFRADRVLLVELTQYTTREPEATHLLRGSIASSIKVYDCGLPASEPLYRTTVETVFPEEGASTWGTNESDLRLSTMEAYSLKVARKFYDHKIKAN